MKIIQVNNVKINIFEEQELKEKLKMKEEDIKIILEYQKTFPELLQCEIDGFVVSARTLYEQLDVTERFQQWFNKRIDKYNFVENEDFCSVKTFTHQNQYGGIKEIQEYKLTLEMAKELCMIQSTDKGSLVRKYFIIMEKALRNYESWNKTRESVKLNANIMKGHIKTWLKKNKPTLPNQNQYSLEFDGINKLLTGYKAQELREHLGYKDKETREHLEEKINEALDILQKMNISMLENNLSYVERMKMIKMLCNSQYKYIKSLL